MNCCNAVGSHSRWQWQRAKVRVLKRPTVSMHCWPVQTSTTMVILLNSIRLFNTIEFLMPRPKNLAWKVQYRCQGEFKMWTSVQSKNITFGSMCTWTKNTNKKVLLRERKRHTVRRVASARYAALSPDGGWGVPRPVLDWGGGKYIYSWMGGGGVPT